MKYAVIHQQHGYTNVAANDLDCSADVEATRNRALLAFSVDRVQHLDGFDLATVQNILRHGEALGTWVTSRDWLTPGERGSLLSIDLHRRIVHYLPEQLRGQALDEGASTTAVTISLKESLELAVLTLTRYLVLLRIGPVGLGRKGVHRSLGPSTILEIAYSYGPALLAQAVVKQVGRAVFDSNSLNEQGTNSRQEGQLLGGLELSDLSTLKVSARKHVLVECMRMRMLSDRALWWDVPDAPEPSRAEAMKGPVRHNVQPAERDSHLPLPDDYVAQMGQRSLWLMRVLAPNLLTIAQKMVEIWAMSSNRGWAAATVRDWRREGVRAILAAHEWRTQEGRRFSGPPFPLRLPALTAFEKTAAAGYLNENDDKLRWPPRSYRDVIALFGVVQLAHYFIVSLSTGARQSEMLSLQRDCVSYAVDGRAYASGKTYKLVQRHEGEWRDWLLPLAAIDAIVQQVRLVSLGEKLSYVNPEIEAREVHVVPAESVPNHLWAQISGGPVSNATEPLRNINPALVSFAQALCMDTAPGGQNLRSHRFRKTLARLVALALRQAPILLMEVFGHESVQMTLAYILTDKDLPAEIETVLCELCVMRAKEMVDRMSDAIIAAKGTESHNLGGYGGLGAVTLFNAVVVHHERVHRRGEQWGANNVMELAELLTLQGTSWVQVRRGVICTKFPGEAGPCNKSKGSPEPSKCQSSCVHRLEEAFLREDVDGAIQESLVAYEQALVDGDCSASSHWAGQVRAHVLRFSDLRAKWMKNVTVQVLMGHEPDSVTA
jgi:integrase